ncbi:hypothetical protein FZ983_30460 [Azospirillum sp. B21]|uniref:hypothetical protein n=1 Tax=Azospirillum sp. B21 TaxID=2607496 RepID=UPI0011EC1397|nr:hypothetical protein [Azospirillum sp. B21]KAA0573338.1 hypothetical protein FZ983_30460 [Azospirillum sp. B21]
MEDNPSVGEKIQETITTGKVNTFTYPAEYFASDRGPGMPSFLKTIKSKGVKVEVMGSKEALSDAGLHPGDVVEGCAVHEGDSGEAGRSLLFKVGLPD